MFIDFFYLLRQKGVPVSVTEWISFTEALYGGFMESSLNHLYYVGRAFLVKSEAYYDMYDLAFREYFGGIAPSRWRSKGAGMAREPRQQAAQAQLRGDGGDEEAAGGDEAEVRPRRDDAHVQGAPEGADGAPRRRRQVDRHGRHAPPSAPTATTPAASAWAARAGWRPPSRWPRRGGSRTTGTTSSSTCGRRRWP